MHLLAQTVAGGLELGDRRRPVPHEALLQGPALLGEVRIHAARVLDRRGAGLQRAPVEPDRRERPGQHVVGTSAFLVVGRQLQSATGQGPALALPAEDVAVAMHQGQSGQGQAARVLSPRLLGVPDLGGYGDLHSLADSLCAAPGGELALAVSQGPGSGMRGRVAGQLAGQRLPGALPQACQLLSIAWNPGHPVQTGHQLVRLVEPGVIGLDAPPPPVATGLRPARAAPRACRARTVAPRSPRPPTCPRRPAPC